ncbi:MAG: hypothetical protein GX811_02700 [Lentisphaerae bacterium]|nr:hypothetical protein [Lentisphaerota bacterium]
MKINFTKREYKVLLEMMYLADWMIHAHEPDRRKDSYRELEQKILSLASEFGYDDLVEYHEDFNEYFHTREFEDDTIRDRIEDYDDATFWDELAYKLAERDVYRKHTEEELARMTREDRALLFFEKERSYTDEFITNGLERIKIE